MSLPMGDSDKSLLLHIPLFEEEGGTVLVLPDSIYESLRARPKGSSPYSPTNTEPTALSPSLTFPDQGQAISLPMGEPYGMISAPALQHHQLPRLLPHGPGIAGGGALGGEAHMTMMHLGDLHHARPSSCSPYPMQHNPLLPPPPSYPMYPYATTLHYPLPLSPPVLPLLGNTMSGDLARTPSPSFPLFPPSLLSREEDGGDDHDGCIKALSAPSAPSPIPMPHGESPELMPFLFSDPMLFLGGGIGPRRTISEGRMFLPSLGAPTASHPIAGPGGTRRRTVSAQGTRSVVREARSVVEKYTMRLWPAYQPSGDLLEGQQRLAWEEWKLEGEEVRQHYISCFEAEERLQSARGTGRGVPGGGLSARASRQRPTRSEIPRPMNSFILYRKNIKALLAHEGIGRVSKVVGQLWAQEQPLVRKHYARLAQIHAAHHKATYPNYRYQPQSRSRQRSPKSSTPP